MDGRERMLLRKKDLVDSLGIAKSTVADWVAEFQVFIPTVKHGAATYYQPEAIDVLQAIKIMREQNLAKPDIYRLLQEQGFAIAVNDTDETVEDIRKALSRTDGRASVMQVMEQVATALDRIADQEEAIEAVEKRQDSLSQRQDGQDGRMVELERTVDELRQLLEATQVELSSARQEIATTRVELEQRKRRWWQFGRK